MENPDFIKYLTTMIIEYSNLNPLEYKFAPLICALIFFLLSFLINSGLAKKEKNLKFIKNTPFFLLGVSIFSVAIAALIRFSFDIEYLLPEIFITRATFFKWTAMQTGIAILFAWGVGAEMVLNKPGLNDAIKYFFKCMAIFILVMLVTLIFEINNLKPVYRKCKNIVDANGITIQTLDSTCGPAALSTLLRLYDIEKSEKELAKAGGTRKNGMTGKEISLCLKNMKDAKERVINFTYLMINPDLLLEFNRPCILGLNCEHWVCLMGYNQKLKKFIIGNPSCGMDLQSEKELMQEWEGKALYLSGLKMASKALLSAPFDKPTKQKLARSLQAKGPNLIKN